MPASAARHLWEADGDAAQLMEFAVDSRAADTRWQRIPGTMFSTMVKNDNAWQALYCVPVFAKFRVRANKLLDTKIYLQAGAPNL